MVDRIKAAVDARTDPDFVIMARTDALAVEGLQAAIDRACACVEAGADMIFPEAITELAMYKAFAAAVKVPILANITEFGATPLFTRRRAARRRRRDRALSAVGVPRDEQGRARRLRDAAPRRHAEGRRRRMQTRAELYDYLGYHAYEAEARRAVRRQEMTAGRAPPTARTEDD